VRPDARALRVVPAAAVVAASAGLGFILYRLTAPRPTVYAAPATAEAPLPQRSAPSHESSAKPRIPERLPPIALPELDGRRRSLAEWQGRPLVVNFWATWCEPCRREVPLLRSLRHERTAEGLEVVGIAIDSHAAVQQYVTAHAIDYPVLLGEEDGLAAVRAFGMDTVLPFSAFADRTGRIVTLKRGELHPEEAQLILDRLRQVDAGTLTLGDAREQISEGLRRLAQLRAAHGTS